MHVIERWRGARCGGEDVQWLYADEKGAALWRTATFLYGFKAIQVCLKPFHLGVCKEQSGSSSAWKIKHKSLLAV